MKYTDQFKILGNFLPTPPWLTQHFSLAYWRVSVDVGLGQRWVGNFPEAYVPKYENMISFRCPRHSTEPIRARNMTYESH